MSSNSNNRSNPLVLLALIPGLLALLLEVLLVLYLWTPLGVRLDRYSVMDMVIFRTIFFELLVFFTFTLLTIHFAY